MLASCSGSPGGGASRAVTTISSGAGAKSEGATSDGATFEGTTSEGGPPFDISSASGETEGTSMILGTRRAASDRPRIAVQTMRNVRAKRRQEYLTIRTAKGARRGLRRSYCAWSRYGHIHRNHRNLSNSHFRAKIGHAPC